MPHIRILYDSERIENLTLTRVAIWNSGNEAVEAADFAPSDRLRLEITPPAKILGVEISYNSTAANNSRVVPADRPDTPIFIEFDYFHRREGIVPDLFHTGVDDNVNVKGTVKGIGSPVRSRPRDDPLTDRVFNPIMGPIIRRARKIPLPFGAIILGYFFSSFFHLRCRS